MTEGKTFCVYMLLTSGGTLYVGQTNDLEKRLKEHRIRKGRGAKYLRMFSAFKLVYSEKEPSLSAALKREAEIKKMSRKEKEKLLTCHHGCK